MPIMKRFSVPIAVAFLITASVMLAVMSTATAQSPPFGVYPGDPVSAADEVFVSLDTSEDATCGVTAANNIRCWGSSRFAPIWAGGFTDVAVGTSHSCGLKLDGTVQCWGVDSFGSNMLTPPTDNGSPIRFKSIDSKTSHTCGIRADNDGLVCWGHDVEGKVSGTRGDSTGLYTSPRPLHRAYDYSNDAFAKISTSNQHTCGTLIPDPGDTSTNVRCWGANSGASGRAVVPEIHLSTIFKDIDAGRNFNCGLIEGGEDDGKAVCWGNQEFGIIGTAIGTSPVEANIGQPSGDRFTKISSGWYHVCGIKTDGTVYCWGATKASGVSQAYGQADVPAEYRRSTFSDVVSARYHTCAILDGQNGQVEGDVVCWGAEIPYDPLRPNIVPDGRVFDSDHPYPPPRIAFLRSVPVSISTAVSALIAIWSAGEDRLCRRASWRVPSRRSTWESSMYVRYETADTSTAGASTTTFRHRDGPSESSLVRPCTPKRPWSKI